MGRTRDRFQAVTLGIFSVASDISVCTGFDSSSKNEYQDINGGKGGRCVSETTLPPLCAERLVIRSLNRPEPSGPHRLFLHSFAKELISHCSTINLFLSTLSGIVCVYELV